MKAIRISEVGGPGVMKPEDVPNPQPKPKEAVIRVEAAGVNFIDVYFRTGQYKGALPMIMGQEAAGVVESVGSGVTEIRVGDRVAYTGVHGSYAEKAAVPVDRLVRVPNGVDSKQAAAAMLQGMTAHYLAMSTYPLKHGDTCLIHAGAGGVGLLLTQIAKLRGARVITTVSTEEKATLSREAGADEIILYTQCDFADEAKKLSGGKGVQVVYDSVGKTTFLKGLDALAPRGMMVLYGQSSGPVEPIDLQILNQKGSVYVTRPSLYHYIATPEELNVRSKEVLGWISEGRLKIRVHQELPLSAAAEAHRLLESRQTMGKLLLIP